VAVVVGTASMNVLPRTLGSGTCARLPAFSPSTRSRAARVGDFGKHVSDETETWAKVIKLAGPHVRIGEIRNADQSGRAIAA
jgi:hypothetical protein